MSDPQGTTEKGRPGRMAPRAMGISTKILGIVAICLLFLVALAATSIWQMAKIGHEITAIAERDMPLTGALTKVSGHQFEQSISLERALRASGVRAGREEARAMFEASLKKFDALAQVVDAEIEKARSIANAGAAAARTQEERALLRQVGEELEKVAAEHKEFDAHAAKAFAHLKRGDLEAARKLLHVIEAEEDELNHALSAMLARVEGFTEHAAEVAEAHEQAALRLMIGLSLAATVLAVVISVLFVRRAITTPLSRVIAGLDALARDDMSVEVAVHSNDEIGRIARAYETFRETLVKAQQLEARQKEMEAKAAAESRKNTIRIADKFEATIGEIIENVAQASAELNSTAQSMSNVAEETNSQANAVAAASEEATSNVQAVASATEEISRSASEIAESVATASSSSRTAVERVEQTSSQMKVLTETARKIDQVITMISEIADQTNLLALNATIESARAGEAGRGFAVVAGEVKDLANQTAKATEEITSHIQEIQQATDTAVSSMEEVSGVIREFDAIASTVADAMGQQRAATQEIARNVHDAATGTQEVTKSITGVTAAAQETGTAATQVTSAVGDLSRQSSTLRDAVADFLVGLREGPADRRRQDDPDYPGPERRQQKASQAA
ncbi:MAG: hypothetical protein Kow0032_16730 [Methyloligellaceae bacterium]